MDNKKGLYSMAIYGYHRTSTTDQHLDRGITEINDYCKTHNLDLVKIYTDQQTGKNFNRPRYQVMKEDVLRSGDILIISELDRLGRNKRDTMKEIQYFKDHDVRLMVLELPTTLIDFSSMKEITAKMMLECINNMMLELYASMAQAEIEKKEKRQREGMAEMKKRGEWHKYGRPKAMNYDVFCKHYQRVLRGEIKPFELIDELGLTKPTYYRYKKQYEDQNGAKTNDGR